MLDDLIIFACALLAFENINLEKYSGVSKLVGGIIMIIIGVVLLFFPE
jgi:cytochrome c biogenesis protein CcdA